MLHLNTALATTSRPDLEERLTGRFYTPETLVAAILQEVGTRPVNTVCDPFCGDGRFIVAWLRAASDEQLAALRGLALWDYDVKAVKIARERVEATLSNLGLSSTVELETNAGDTFEQALTPRFDLVLTNPPWEQLKPDSRDKVGDAASYKTAIQAYSSRLAQSFPEAKTATSRSIGGYTVNLARAGALLALAICKPGGNVGIVLPSTIFGDQVSSEFRSRFFDTLHVSTVSFYPAEARLFSGVDQSVVTVTGQLSGPSDNFNLRRFHSDLRLREQRTCTNPNGASIPLEIGGAEHALVKSMAARHPPLSWLEADLRYGLRLGRELDETRIREAFTDTPQGIPFVKGRDVMRFGHPPEGLPRIDPRARTIPRTVQVNRVAWRDVSRASQKRRVQACKIPMGYVTGNSLGIAHFSSPTEGLNETLLAVMNSLSFEIQIRSKLTTNHVSQGVLRSASVPYACFEAPEVRAVLASLSSSAGAENLSHLTLREIVVAKAFGLDRNDFAALLDSFPKLTNEETAALLNKSAWS
ncbi:N-6 DNA methylase [Brevundimonas sp.]|uniref:N-6 DNA methylase n=1 Tax=Brevundimonas sp. TaxID=1871086 RepID=UPI00289EA42D|nr:N-6 DNA methylase [Brevundimonas sp.]